MGETIMKSSKRQVEEYEKKYGIKMDILTELCGKCYVLDLDGDYNYTECFGKADSEYIKQQNYQLIYPEIIIKFYSFKDITKVKYLGNEMLVFSGWKLMFTIDNTLYGAVAL